MIIGARAYNSLMAVYDGIGSMVLIVTDHVNAGEAGAAISDGRAPKEDTF